MSLLSRRPSGTVALQETLPGSTPSGDDETAGGHLRGRELNSGQGSLRDAPIPDAPLAGSISGAVVRYRSLRRAGRVRPNALERGSTVQCDASTTDAVLRQIGHRHRLPLGVADAGTGVDYAGPVASARSMRRKCRERTSRALACEPAHSRRRDGDTSPRHSVELRGSPRWVARYLIPGGGHATAVRRCLRRTALESCHFEVSVSRF